MSLLICLMSVNRCDNPLFFGISYINVSYILSEMWTFQCDQSKSGLSLPSLTLSRTLTFVLKFGPLISSLELQKTSNLSRTPNRAKTDQNRTQKAVKMWLATSEKLPNTSPNVSHHLYNPFLEKYMSIHAASDGRACIP